MVASRVAGEEGEGHLVVVAVAAVGERGVAVTAEREAKEEHLEMVAAGVTMEVAVEMVVAAE